MVRKLPEEIAGLKEEWAAISFDDRLVGHGKSPEDAIAAAAAAGCGITDFALLWVPDEWPGVLVL